MALMKMDQLPLKKKLRTVMITIGVAGIVLAALAFFINDLIRIRKSTLQEAGAIVNVIQMDASVALGFRDSAMAEETLSALKYQPLILQACIFDNQNRVFATYSREDVSVELCRPDVKNEVRLFTGGYVDIVQPLIWDNENFGKLHIRYSLEAIISQLVNYLFISFIMLSLITALVVFFSHQLARVISFPILQLAETADRVEKEGDYALRATRVSNDEIGVLVDGFNSMLEEIQARDAELARQNILLEEKVRDRTAELENKNRDLQKAMEEIKILRGILPICSNCKKIRSDKGLWEQLEAYIETRTDASFSHGICPDCAEKLYGEEEWYQELIKGK